MELSKADIRAGLIAKDHRDHLDEIEEQRVLDKEAWKLAQDDSKDQDLHRSGYKSDSD